MPVLYKPSQFAFYTEGELLTEQEHKNSCDINKMIKNAHRGLPVRGGYSPQYGYDDMTMDGVQFRIQKAELEKSLHEVSETEFSQREFDLIPKEIREKFKFKVKKEATDDQNAMVNEQKRPSDAKMVTQPPLTPNAQESAHDGPINSLNGA